VNCESRTGASALWLSTLDEKRDAGEILYDLTIVENHASQAHKAFIILSIPQYEETFLPNFRNGDVVVLYERNNGMDNVTNKMVFKGNIESITDNELRIRLRAAQQNPLVFPENSRYAVEHDTMDTTFRSMYLGLSSFMDANPERRELLLGQRPPRFDMAYEDRIARTTDDFERVALKAEAACDYFLLVGPPGTGKTSRALRRMVEHFYACPSTQVLLLAYTNRAVDEICRSLSAILPQVDYIRVGSELSCDARFRKHLLENVLAECNNRREVNIRMADCRIYVGTVASIASKPELFKLKHFDVAIVDEATQILEPQLLGILCARFKDGRNGIGKFILIGDHKQLPAVVLQSNEQSEVHDEGLRRIGLYNLKDSLFERLYRFHLQEEHCRAVDMLCRQGRMHPGVASFPNREFYAGKLEALGLPHQLENVDAPVRFIPSERDTESVSGKTNRNEARIVAQLAADVYHLYKETFEVNRTLGVITPYRSQIALIRKEIQALGISALNEISVDTVERYQGSERDVIIYSFCVNYLYQLKFLPNLTEENGVWIDRKLNVALTRARRQLYITGVPDILNHNLIYRRLIQAIN
jgi:DNA helicase